ncbi:MAG: TonB-dependent receptor, partial [Candidatus Korobacteraceae bacterium]
RFTARSNEIGSFVLVNLPVGESLVTVEAPTFANATSRVLVQAGRTAQLEFRMQIAQVAQELTVLETAPLLQTRSAEIDDVVGTQQVVDLPLNGRQFIQLANLSDTVVLPPGGTRGAALNQTGPLINVGGQRAGHNIYLVDGSKVTDEYFNNLVISPSIDSIHEFRIQKQLYSAEYGGKAAALVNVVTKSGTNRLHGSAFEFLRNSAFDARNYFADPNAPIPPFRQNQFGATLGGPLVIPGAYNGHGKTFFFLSYDALRVRRSETRVFSVPTAAMRAGNLTGLAASFDPLTTDALTGARQPFANNTIPGNRIDPVAQSMLAQIPLPNLPGIAQNYRGVERETNDLDQGSIRIDHSFSDSDSIFGRYTAFEARAFQPFGTSILNETLLPGFGRDLTTHTKNAVIDWRHAFSPALLNTFRVGWLTVSGGQANQNSGINFPAAAGLQGVSPDSRDLGYPFFNLSGQFSPFGDPSLAVTRANRNIEFTETLMIHKSGHTLTMGGYLFVLRFNPVAPNTARGQYVFTPRWTQSCSQLTGSGCTPSAGNAFADFLLGYPTQANVGIGRQDERGQTLWFHPYIQDDWQVTPNLTLNIGLRWEYNQQMRDQDNRLSLVDFAGGPAARYVIATDEDGNIHPSANALLPLIPNGIPVTTSAALGWDRSLLDNSLKRFSPRLGFSWRLPTKADMVLRGGFGIHNNQWAYSVQQDLAANLPFFFNKQVVTSAGAALPTLTTRNILASTAAAPGGNTMIHEYKPEYNQAWSLSVQHQLMPDLLYEVAYFGSRINHADNRTVLNVPVEGPGNIAARRPAPQLAQVVAIRWDGWSSYNALRLRVEKRASHGLFLSANHTWSRSIDDASDPGGTEYEANLPQDVYNYNIRRPGGLTERALSSFHHLHRFTGMASYQLPVPAMNGALGVLANGWQLSGIFTAQSGAPFTVNLGSDNANVGPGPAQRPDVIRNPNLSSGRSPDRWFDTGAFVMPAAFTFGNSSRNIVFAPGDVQLDMALQKEFPLRREDMRLQFRTEMFNVLNRANFGVPNRVAFTPNFGRISSARDARQMQLALKLLF